MDYGHEDLKNLANFEVFVSIEISWHSLKENTRVYLLMSTAKPGVHFEVTDNFKS